MADLDTIIKDYFSLIEAEAQETPPEQQQPPLELSPEAHNSMMALGAHSHYSRRDRKAKEAAQSDVAPETVTQQLTPEERAQILKPQDIAAHHDIIANELIGNHKAPGPAFKHAISLAKKIKKNNGIDIDPDELISEFAKTSKPKSENEAPKSRMLRLVIRHGHELIENPEKAGSLRSRLKMGMRQTAMNLLRDMRTVKETPSDELDKLPTVKDARAASRQRENNPLLSAIYNEQQKLIDDLMRKHIEHLHSKYKGNPTKIHPDIIHHLLMGNLFHGKKLEDLAKEFGQHIPAKNPNATTEKQLHSKKLQIHRAINTFRKETAPHLGERRVSSVKPQKSEVQKGTELEPMAQPGTEPEPDPMKHPWSYGEFKRAAGSWRKTRAAPEKVAKRVERSQEKLKSLRKPQAEPEKEKEPEFPEEVPEKAHDTPRMPGLQ